MPLLMCPNDNAAMQTVERTGVKFDMCPTCRGVWLDRGELETLMSSAQAEAPAATSSPTAYDPGPQQRSQPLPPGPPSGPWRGEDRSDGRRGYDDRYDDRRPDPRYQHKKKRDSIFDIFD